MTAIGISLSNPSSSFFESPWKKVVVHRKDKHGQVIFWKEVANQPGKYKKTFSEGSPEVIYTEDTRTGELYKGGEIDDDSSYVVRVKAIIASLVMPVFAISHMSWYGLKGIYEVGKSAKAAFHNISQRPASLSMAASILKNGRTLVIDSTSSLVRNFWRVVRTPFYAIATQAALSMTVFLGYEGRKWEAIVERSWQKDSWKLDWRMMKAPESLGTWKAFVEDVRNAKACYLAFCFQPKGNIKDTKRFIKIRYEQ